MKDLIDRQAVRLIESDPDAYPQEWNDDYENGFTDALNKVLALPSAQPEQKIEELLPDGTLHLVTDADLSKVGRVLVSQNGTHYGVLYYADGEPKPSAQPERKAGRWIETKHDLYDYFICSECCAGFTDGFQFRYCPNCGAKMEDGDE